MDAVSYSISFFSCNFSFGLYPCIFSSSIFQCVDTTTAPQMFARFVSTVLDQSAPGTLSPDGRSSSGNIYTPPSSVDDVAICVSSSSSSLNAISGTGLQYHHHHHQDTSNGTTKMSVFKRVGSYSPARRQRKMTEGKESKKEKS